jgi:hypothetical protein
VQEILSLEERLAAASLGGAAGNYVKQLEEYAVSKGMGIPTYKFTQQRSNRKLYYFCNIKVSIEIAQNKRLKRFCFTYSHHRNYIISHSCNTFQVNNHYFCNFTYQHAPELPFYVKR